MLYSTLFGIYSRVLSDGGIFSRFKDEKNDLLLLSIEMASNAFTIIYMYCIYYTLHYWIYCPSNVKLVNTFDQFVQLLCKNRRKEDFLQQVKERSVRLANRDRDRKRLEELW